MPIARAETERVRDDHRLTGFDNVDWHDRGVHRRDVVAVAYLGWHRVAVFEADVLGFGVEQPQTDDRRITGGVRSTLQRVDDPDTGLGGLQTRVEPREIESFLRPPFAASPTGAFARGGRQPRRDAID